ncbi:MAG: class I SAM-dependent methyltransferase [Hyphomicrobium sp.]|nr:class I SAM-dependent methyltransferase [Hyphomicrobium sp.]
MSSGSVGAGTKTDGAAGRHRVLTMDAGLLAVFSGTLFLSALLLFSVQPMFAKMVLPQLGGSPSVWAVSTCFFQAVLLAGYCYAHVLNRFVDWRLAPGVHLAVLVAAFMALPIALPGGLSDPPSEGAAAWLIGVLAIGVGLPFFAVSANAPLLQAWFSRTGSQHAADPYFLYGASNLGSLLALLAYPIAIEPVIGLQVQASLWTTGFFLLAVSIAASALVMLNFAPARVSATSLVARDFSGETPTVGRVLSWIFYAAVPSGLLVAFTTHLSTDIAAAPFLWVIPLAIFLATFVVVFRERALVPMGSVTLLQPAAVLLALMSLVSVRFEWWHASIVTFAAFLLTTLVAHRRLYDERPDARHLTGFYLWMSFGGMLGGLFAAIVAPQVFNATYELPLLLIAGMMCRPGAMAPIDKPVLRRLALVATVGGLILLTGFGLMASGKREFAWMLANIIMPFAAVPLLLWRHDARSQAAVVAVLVAVVVMLPSMLNRGEPVRSFFGVHRIIETPDGQIRRLAHGTTSHGAERLIGLDGRPVSRPVPATYYHPFSPMAKAVDVARENHDGQRVFRAGIVGLGIGSMACYAKEREVWRFFEIDQAVVDIATNPKRFRFLSTCQPNPDIVLGDARLTVAKEAGASFDYLQIDAFSSDSVPTHLLTVEAIGLYLDKLSRDGVLAVHVSNRHLDLAPVAAAAAKAHDGAQVAIVRSMDAGAMPEDMGSIVVIVTKSPAVFSAFREWRDTEVVASATVPAWTDDYSDILSALRRHYGW